MVTDSLFWIWMQEVLGPGSLKARQVLELAGPPENLYNMSRHQLSDLGCFAPKEIEHILSCRSLEKAQTNQRKAARVGARILTPDLPEFPANLTNIDGLPCVLYVLGELDGLEDQLTIAMVGTRKCTEYGKKAARQLAFDLSKAGCAIVSGLAAGIDFVCHEGALEAGGRTIGFLACGLDVDYPQSSNRLKRRILNQGGALVTEFPFREAPHAYHFAIRNRLISGISNGVIVVQAPASSGALITARHAAEQGKEVFALPGEIFDWTMAGCNALIRDGAKMVLSAASVLEEYKNLLPDAADLGNLPQRLWEQEAPEGAHLPKKVKKTPPLKEQPVPLAAKKQPEDLGLTGLAAQVYRLLGSAPKELELLCQDSGAPVEELLTVLTQLELLGLVKNLPGRRYCLQNEDR